MITWDWARNRYHRRTDAAAAAAAAAAAVAAAAVAAVVVVAAAAVFVADPLTANNDAGFVSVPLGPPINPITSNV